MTNFSFFDKIFNFFVFLDFWWIFQFWKFCQKWKISQKLKNSSKIKKFVKKQKNVKNRKIRSQIENILTAQQISISHTQTETLFFLSPEWVTSAGSHPARKMPTNFYKYCEIPWETQFFPPSLLTDLLQAPRTWCVVDSK